MKKVIFSLTVLLCSISVISAKAQVAVSVRVGAPIYYRPARVVVVAKPAPVVVVRPHPVYVVARPARRVVIYR